MIDNKQLIIDIIYDRIERETKGINVDDWVLYDLISDGWTYDELCDYFSTSEIERVSGMVMRGESPE